MPLLIFIAVARHRSDHEKKKRTVETFCLSLSFPEDEETPVIGPVVS